MQSPSAAATASRYRPGPAFAHGPARSGFRGPLSWARRAEAWLDNRGRNAWIAAMVLGFIVAWPVGLFLVFYITWTQRWSHDMFGQSCRKSRQTSPQSWGRYGSAAFRPSGNSTFDNYKAETLRRLEDEQEAFEGFLQRLREAKDKQEFDAFMEDRARATRDSAETETADEATPGPDAPRKGEY